MTTLRDWLLWNKKRALIASAVLLAVVTVVLYLAMYASSVHRYHLALEKYEQQQADKAAGIDEEKWYITVPPSTPSATSTASPTAVPSTTAPSVDPAAQEDLHEHAEEEDPAASASEIAAARSVAAAFTSGWLAGAGTTDSLVWSLPLVPLVTPEVASALPMTEMAAIPAATLTETTVTTSSIADVVVHATLSDGTALDVTVSATGRGWLVSDYGPAAA